MRRLGLPGSVGPLTQIARHELSGVACDATGLPSLAWLPTLANAAFVAVVGSRLVLYTLCALEDRVPTVRESVLFENIGQVSGSGINGPDSHVQLKVLPWTAYPQPESFLVVINNGLGCTKLSFGLF